jgi:mRNA interferase MazF
MEKQGMKRGEIWLINLDPTIGAEIRKTRPAVVISVDAMGILPLRVIVPVTGWQERYAVAPWMVCLEPDTRNNLSKMSAADAFQVRSVSTAHFVERLGTISDAQMDEIGGALRLVLGWR